LKNSTLKNLSFKSQESIDKLFKCEEEDNSLINNNLNLKIIHESDEKKLILNSEK